MTYVCTYVHTDRQTTLVVKSLSRLKRKSDIFNDELYVI